MDVQSIAKELARLQTNRGLQTGDLSQKVGPQLSCLTGFSGERPDARASLTRQLVLASSALTPDGRLVFLRACATRPTDAPKLGERLTTVARHINRSRDVARRRLTQANLKVAEALLQVNRDDKAWYIDEFHVRVDFREESPVYRVRHRLVVLAPTLRQLTEQVSLPGDDGSVALEFAVSGDASLGSIVRTHRQTWAISMPLDREYSCGDAIHYETAVRLPDRRDAPPMEVMVPARDCHRFSAQVWLGDLANQVWTLDGVTPPTVQDATPSGAMIDSRVEPEPYVSFENLIPGLVYGLRWTWSSW